MDSIKRVLTKILCFVLQVSSICQWGVEKRDHNPQENKLTLTCDWIPQSWVNILGMEICYFAPWCLFHISKEVSTTFTSSGFTHFEAKPSFFVCTNFGWRWWGTRHLCSCYLLPLSFLYFHSSYGQHLPAQGLTMTLEPTHALCAPLFPWTQTLPASLRQVQA